MDLLSSLGTNIQSSLTELAVLIAAGWLGYKKLIKQANKEDLDATKSKTEKGVIDLIYVRLHELEKINKALYEELDTLRKENLIARQQNTNLIDEIQQLKQFIAMNFVPTNGS